MSGKNPNTDQSKSAIHSGKSGKPKTSKGKEASQNKGSNSKYTTDPSSAAGASAPSQRGKGKPGLNGYRLANVHILDAMSQLSPASVTTYQKKIANAEELELIVGKPRRTAQKPSQSESTIDKKQDRFRDPVKFVKLLRDKRYSEDAAIKALDLKVMQNPALSSAVEELKRSYLAIKKVDPNDRKNADHKSKFDSISQAKQMLQQQLQTCEIDADYIDSLIDQLGGVNDLEDEDAPTD